MSSRCDSASHCFAFEQDFIGNWRCIPLCVRRKLDLCGVKLKLNHWLELSQEQRQALVDWPDGAMLSSSFANTCAIARVSWPMAWPRICHR